MEQKVPLVSICIPTFNRATYLQNSLNSILMQPEIHTGLVEVVISDNASTDDTEYICKSYTQKSKYIRYYRNDKNLADRNFLKVLGYAKGVLRKICNDNIIYNSGSLKFFCDQAMKYYEKRPILFFQNGKCKNRIGSNPEYLNFNNFLKYEGYLVTWLLSYSVWDFDYENIKNNTIDENSHLWQVEILARLLGSGRLATIVEGKFASVQRLERKNVSYGIFKVFYTDFYAILQPYFEKGILSKECIEWVKKNELYDFFTIWIIRCDRSSDLYEFSHSENLKECVFEQYKNEKYFKRYLIYYFMQLIKENIKIFVKKKGN
jgi:abequosyltransferase